MNPDLSFDVPILFLIFNRPETTQKVFDVIRLIRPRRLFVAADGPRPGMDADFRNCAAARLITHKIDWPCDVQYRFLEKNYGCRRAVSGAISWFFSQVEYGIVLEDDCLPSVDFFYFCSAALETYRDDERVMHVNGTIHVPPAGLKDNAWFSRYALVWGWASWRRAWKNYDPLLLNYPFAKLHKIFDHEKSMRWRELLNNVRQNKSGFNTWDFQWSAALFACNGIAVSPKVNLIQNIGIGSGTHEIRSSLQYSLPEEKVWDAEKIDLPVSGYPDLSADDIIFDRVYRKTSLKQRGWKKIKRFFR